VGVGAPQKNEVPEPIARQLADADRMRGAAQIDARVIVIEPGQDHLMWRSRIIVEHEDRRAIVEPQLRERTAQILADINLTARRDVPAGLLTYAEQRALEIGITVAGGADVILLDEPTAGMSRAETERAVALIRRLTEGRTLLIVEHDMSVVFGLADRISVLVYGQIIASGTPQEIRGNPKVREAYLGEEAA